MWFMSRFTRRCFFCGHVPRSSERTDEHTLPRWLNQVSGGTPPGQAFHFSGGTSIPLERSVFPACASCNGLYGRTMEPLAQAAIYSLLEDRSVSLRQLDTLFPWMEKVRCAEYFHHARDKIIEGNPPYPAFVSGYVGRRDHVLVLVRSKTIRKGLKLISDPLLHQHHSSCIVLGVNDLLIVSYSRRHISTGFPGNIYPLMMLEWMFREGDSLRPRGPVQLHAPPPMLSFPITEGAVVLFRPSPAVTVGERNDMEWLSLVEPVVFQVQGESNHYTKLTSDLASLPRSGMDWQTAVRWAELVCCDFWIHSVKMGSALYGQDQAWGIAYATKRKEAIERLSRREYDWYASGKSRLMIWNEGDEPEVRIAPRVLNVESSIPHVVPRRRLVMPE